VAWRGQIYAFGFGLVHAYDIRTDTWQEKPSFEFRRKITVAILDDKMYAFRGGESDGKCENFVDCYDPVLDVWHRINEIEFGGHCLVGVHV